MKKKKCKKLFFCKNKIQSNFVIFYGIHFSSYTFFFAYNRLGIGRWFFLFNSKKFFTTYFEVVKKLPTCFFIGV